MDYLAIVGYLMVIVMMYFLMKGKATPIALFIVLPVIAGFIAGFSVKEMDTFIKTGINQTTSNAILFCFSVVYFGIMNDLGIFDPIVDFLVAKAGNNIVAITVVSGIVGIIAHLDGSTATTVLVTIPAMLPIYKRLNIRPHVLLCLVAASMGVMNLVPWGGPTARAAVVTGLDANYLWHQLLPIQAVGVICVIVLGVVLGMQEKLRGAGINNANFPNGISTANISQTATSGETKINGSKAKLIFNMLLTIGMLVVLSLGKVQAYTVFMVAFSIALIVNYKDLKTQDNVIKKHAPAAFLIAATMLASGVFVGVLNGGKPTMLTQMSTVLLNVIPPFVSQYLHIIMGILGMPLGMILGTDSFFYGLMPLCINIGLNFGITAESMALSMLLGKNVGLMISPLVPATFLAIGLADVELKDHIMFSFKYLIVVSIVMVASGLVFGLYPL